MPTKAHIEANKRYQATQENIVIRVKKGEREKIRAHAASKGIKVQAYIKRLIADDMGDVEL